MGASGNILSLGVDVSSNPDAAPQIEKITAAIAKFRAEAAQAKSADIGVQLAQDVNVAIGAFAKLGQTIDLTNARAVAGYAAIGEALRAQLVTLGATEAELNRISASVVKVQQAAGAAGLGTFIPASFTSNLNGTGFATRRAASAIAELSLAAQGGKVSFGALSVGAGAITADFAALAGVSLGLATGIGAIVTVGLALIGVLEGMGSKSKTAEQNLASFREEAKKTASTDALRGQLAQQNKDLKDALAERQKLQGQQAATGGAPVTDPTTGQIVSGAQNLSTSAAIDALDERIKKLQADQAATLNDLNKRGPEAIKQLADAERTLNQQAAVDAARRTEGEFAARRLAAEDEYTDEKKRLDDLALAQGQQDAAVAAAKRQRDAQIAQIDLEEAEKLADAKAATEKKSQDAIAARAIENNKANLVQAEQTLQTSLANRTISEVQFIAQRLAAQKAAIEADKQAQLSAAQKTLVAQQAAANAAVNPQDREKRQADADATQAKLGEIRERARVQDAEADRQAAKETEALALELAKTVEQANIAVLDSQGQFVAAAQAQVQNEFRESIATAVAEIASGNLEGVNALAVLKSRMDQIVGAAGLKQVGAQHQDVQGELQAQMRTIQAQQTEGALSQADAEKQVVAALQQAQVEISKLIEAQQALVASQPDNKQAKIDLANLNAEYIELGNTITKLEDPFAALKEAATGATQSALSTLAGDATKLVSQSHVEVNALTGELQNAQTELNQLLAVPANERTSNQTERITELRTEVESLTVSLGNAKLALTTWKSLFLDAAQSIVDALIKVSAQMLATEIIQKGLAFLAFVTGGGGAGVEGEDLPLHNAAGGFIRGRGSSTSDSIPAMLSNGEFVVNAAATAQNRALLEHINGTGLRRMPRHYAGGGIVTRGPSADAALARAHIVVEASPDLLVRQMDTPTGHAITVKVIQKNGRAVAAALPQR